MRKIQTYFHSLLFVFIFVMFVYSCKVKRQAKEVNTVNKSKSSMLFEMKKNEFHYNTFTGKANVSIVSNGKKSSIKAVVKMQKDSAIWINFSYIGFAGARVLITQDSIKLINYKEAKYLISDFDYINQILKIDADFEMIQSLLVGNSVAFDEDEKLKTTADNDNYYLSSMRKRQLLRGMPEKRLDKLDRKQEKNPERQRYVKKQERKEDKFSEDVYSIWLDKRTHKIVKTLVKDFINEVEVTAQYDDFRVNDNQLFPFDLNFYLMAKDTTKVTVNYSKVVKDKPVNFLFNIPSKYEKMAN